MRKVPALVIVLALLLSGLAGSAIAQEKPVSVIIGFTEDNLDQIHVLVQTEGGTVKEVWNFINAAHVTLPPQAIEAVAHNPNVIYVEPNATVYAVAKPPGAGGGKPKPQQPAQETPWGITKIGADQAWAYSTGAGVKVAVLDTGIDPKHSDLNVVAGVSVVGPRETTDPKFWRDTNGHGTFVAGIVAALNNDIGVVGVAPAASLYAVKVLGNDGSGTYADVIDGILWAIQNGMQVVNMSLGGAVDSQALRDAVDAAAAAGLVLVAAAGNGGDGNADTTELSYPAAYDSVIAAGATDQNNVAPYWSNSGLYLELAAPGVDIKSTYIEDAYATGSGTSASAPHVSGVAALVWATDSTLTNGQIRAILQTTADDLPPAGKDTVYGYGLVDAYEPVAPAS